MAKNTTPNENPEPGALPIFSVTRTTTYTWTIQAEDIQCACKDYMTFLRPTTAKRYERVTIREITPQEA